VRYVLGVDGGASKTHALVVASTGRVMGFGVGGPCNHQVSGMARVLDTLRETVGEALREAQLEPAHIDVGRFCLAGADLEEDFVKLQGEVEKLEISRTTIIDNDTTAALRAGLTRPWGVAVICGTGFNAMGRDPDGREVRLPSLGAISGDWGGGAALSEEMIRAVMRAWDGRGKSTLLTRLVLDALKVESEEVLLVKLYHEEIRGRALLDLVPLLFDAALERDETAADLIVRMGEEVGVTANAIIRRLSLERRDVEVVLGGSIFKGRGPLLVDTATQLIHRQAPSARIVRLCHDPVFGAALLALEAAGGEVTEEQQRRLESSLPPVLKAE
jgi:N-acetylglucosamine kinase-like BadF-type ATPase